jgi:hypothetical protein
MRFLPAAIQKLAIRKRAYQAVFPAGPARDIVLKDLATFCRAFGGEVECGDHDRTLLMAGRKEAFWRIFAHLHLSEHELAALYGAAVIGDDQ